ncbi:RNA-directed DNA polymerase, eukaryota [Tanacetum coccineum]
MVVFDSNQLASSLSEEDDVAVSNLHVGTVYDSLDECIEMYRKYASEAGFGVRLSCQKRLKCGYVKQMYIVCNREGCPKDVWLNTLDPKKNDRQVRSSNFGVCGCKACVLFDMVPHTTKYTLTTFYVEHNHDLDRVDYRNLSKAERKLTYNEQLFIIKAANANIGSVRAHNLYTGLKDSDAMLITRMEERQEFTKDFSFYYFVEDAELCCLFWADEVGKCNYKEFGDIVSFDVTYKTNKYKMVFVPFTAIDNHRRSVAVGSGLLKRETLEAYGWLLRAFKKAFVRAPNIVVTDQDGSIRLVVAAEFPESKHRLCMWISCRRSHPRIYDETDFKDKFGKIIWNMFIGPEEFEDRWNKFMEEFNLVNHSGFQRCIVLDHHGSLLYLLILHYVDHTAKVYTRSLFIRVQKEIVAGSWLCSITGMSSDEGCIVCIIDEEKIKPCPPEVIDKERTSENVEGEINLHQKVTGHYKNEAIEKLAMEFSIILDSCVHMLSNNEPKLSVFVNKMKAIKSELEAELPIVLTRTVFDFVQEFMGVKKPDKVKLKNPTCVRPKGLVVPSGSDHVDGGL